MDKRPNRKFKHNAHQDKHSEEFKKLIDNSSYRGINSEWLEDYRKFISKAINQDGKILDIGCGNGLLLFCLQVWSKHKLEPFGIDTNKEAIKEAKNNFEIYKENFIEKNILEISKLPPNFPKKFDIIFWSIWINWEFKSPKEIESLNKVLQLVKPGGRLIMGFYNTRRISIRKALKSGSHGQIICNEGVRSRNQIKRMKELGLKVVRPVRNPTGSEMLTWVDIT